MPANPNEPVPPPDQPDSPPPSEPERKPPQYAGSVTLGDELIERCSGSHSMGLVYQFLRNAGNGLDAASNSNC
jgi:hypothetical protein